MHAAKKYTEFEELFRDSYNRLYFYALNLIGDKETVADIVGDAFEYLWKHYEDIQDAATPPLAALYTFVRSRCMDHLRRCDIRNRYEAYVTLFSERIDDEEYWEERHERISRIMTLIQQLPPKTQQAFKSCFLYGKSYKETGEEMGVSVNTVKTHIVKALAFIRERVRGVKGN